MQWVHERSVSLCAVLDARPGDVLVMVLREGVAWSAVGVALGLPLAALLGRALSSVIFDVTQLDPVVFTVAPRCWRSGRSPRR